MVFIKFLLFLIVIGVGYLCFAQYQEKQSIDSTPKTLIIDVVDFDDSLSDRMQDEDALADGGMIRISNDNDWLAFGFEFWNYGARDSKRYAYTLGALMNYVASNGWSLVQAPSNNLYTRYYFKK